MEQERNREKQVFLVGFSLTFPRFLRISKNQLNTSLTWVCILWRWASMLTELAGDGECRLLCSRRSEIFWQMKFIVFQGCSTKQVAFLPEQPPPFNQLLIQPLLLVPECYFAYNVEAKVLKF